MIIVSELVFEKVGMTAQRFFKTEHTSFYRFPDGEIFTLTSYDMRVSPLGVAGVPFVDFEWGLVEDDKLVFESMVLKEFERFDPRIRFLTDSFPSCERYSEILYERAGMEFERIVNFLRNDEVEKIVGLGPGLTPLGDDVLSGMITAGYRPEFPIRTNDISRQQIVHAVKGYVPLPVKEFLETGEDELILQMGATSGAGWAFGITHTLGGCKWSTR